MQTVCTLAVRLVQVCGCTLVLVHVHMLWRRTVFLLKHQDDVMRWL